jgi:hypothetical protein
MTARPVFVIHLEPTPDSDGLISLKGLLTVASRRFGLRCVALRIEPPAPDPPEAGQPSAAAGTTERKLSNANSRT